MTRFTAHPTEYGGIKFRSRLEATWAAYFDLRQIRWEYEPADLSGWVPDFLIRPVGKEVWIEVKPSVDPSSASPEFSKAVAHVKDIWIGLFGLGGSVGLCDQPSRDMMEWLDVMDALDAGVTDETGHIAVDADQWRRASNITRWRAP